MRGLAWACGLAGLACYLNELRHMLRHDLVGRLLDTRGYWDLSTAQAIKQVLIAC